MDCSLVKYNPDTGNITGFVQNLKSLFALKPPTEETISWFKELDQYASLAGITISDSAKDLNVTEDSAIKFATAVKNGSVQLKEGQTMLQGYQAWMKATGKESEIAAIKVKAMTAATKLLSTIGWAAVIAAGTWAIGKLADAVDHYINRAKYAAEAAETAQSKIDELNDSYKSHADLVNEVGDRYAELSERVNKNTNANIDLSADDYEEYLDINKQLAEAFPGLVTAMDENGNAILKMGDSSEETTKKLQEQLKAEQDLNNYKISQEMGDVIGGVAVKYEEAQKAADSSKESIDNANAALEDTQKIYEEGADLSDHISFSGSVYDDSVLKRINLYQDAVKQFYEELDPARRNELAESTDHLFDNLYTVDENREVYQFYLDTFSLTDDERQRLNEILKEQAVELKYNLQDSVGQLTAEQNQKDQDAEMAWKDAIPSLQASAKSLATYKELVDQSPSLSSVIDQMIGKIDISEMPKIQEVGWDEYLRQNIITPLTNASESERAEITDIWNKLINFDPSNLSISDAQKKIDQYVNILATLLNRDPIEIKIALGFDDYTEGQGGLVDNLKQSIEAAKNQYADYTNWDGWYDANIRTQEELDSWNNIRAEIDDATEAQKEFLAQKNSTPAEVPEFWDYNKTLTQLDTVKEKLEVLDQTYAKLFDPDEKIGFDDYSAILDAFKDVEGLDFTSYVQQFEAAGQNTEKVKDITEQLITEYLNLSGVLDNVTAENQGLITSMLEEMGIKNADQIVTDALAQNTNYLAAQKILAANASIDLANMTAVELDALANESNMADTTKQQLALLALQKQLCNNTAIMTDGDIANLEALAKQAGATQTAIAAIKLTEKKVESAGAGRRYTNNPEDMKKLWQNTYNEIYDSIGNKAQLKNLYSANSGAGRATNGGIKPSYGGGSNTKKAIEDAQDAADKAAKDAEDEYDETVDYFERRVEVIQQAISVLEKSLDNVLGSKAKNTLLDRQSGIVKQEMQNYSDALNMYQEKADDALSKIDKSLRDKVVNGSVSITEYVGDGNKEVVEAIQEYQKWANKVGDCKEQLAELAKQIREIELSKFNNIVDEYTEKFELFSKATDNINKQIDLFEEAGQVIGEAFYDAQKQNSQKQLNILEEEKNKLVQQLNNSLSSNKIQKGTDEWVEMVNTLSELDGSILDCKKSIEEMDNAILNLHTEQFERIQTAFSNVRTELENIYDLIDVKDIDVSDVNGNWSQEGIAKLGLLAQQYETAKLQAQRYGEEIGQLNKDYMAGKYSATEYADRLAELNQSQYDAIDAYESAKDAMIEVNKTRVDIMIDGINDEIDAMSKLISKKKEELSAEQDLYTYRKTIAEKNKSVTDIERQLAAISNDNSASARAQKAKLQEQLQEAKDDLADYEYTHSIDEQQNALDKEQEDYETAQQQRIDSLNAYLENREQVISDSFGIVKANTSIVAAEITQIAQEHGVKISDTITKAWSQGENAIASYGNTLSSSSSVFIAELMNVENGVYRISTQANATAASLGYMFSTSAANLLGQLDASYNSVGNVNTMTQTLHNSMVETLEKGYNISKVTSGLESIKNAADKATSAAKKLASALDATDGGSRSSKITSNDETTSNDSGSRYRIVDKRYKKSKESKYILVDNLRDDATLRKYMDKYRNELSKGNLFVMRYAKGGIISKYKNSPLNAIARSVGEDTMIAAKEGESVLTPDQTKGLIDLKPLLERMIQLPDYTSTATVKPSMDNFFSSIPSIQIDKIVGVDTVAGSLDSATMPQVEKAIQNGINNFGRKLTKQIRYGGT